MWSIPHHASLQSRGDCQSFVDAVGKHSCCQAVVCGVGPLDDFMDAMETHDLLHWAKNLRVWEQEWYDEGIQSLGLCHVPSGAAEYLFFGDTHIVCDIWEDGGLDEKSLLTPCGPSTFQCGSLSLPTLYQLHYLIKLLLVDLQKTASCGSGYFLFVCLGRFASWPLRQHQLLNKRASCIPVGPDPPLAAVGFPRLCIWLSQRCDGQTPRRLVPPQTPWIQPDSTGPG